MPKARKHAGQKFTMRPAGRASIDAQRFVHARIAMRVACARCDEGMSARACARTPVGGPGKSSRRVVDSGKNRD